MSNTGSWRTSTSEREMVARARAHWAASIVDRQVQIWGGFDHGADSIVGWLRSLIVGSRSGVASITGRLRSGEGSRVPPRRPQPRAHRPH
ncbi:hypothetical protein FCV25MIE_30277 [Fagus crenata]